MDGDSTFVLEIIKWIRVGRDIHRYVYLETALSFKEDDYDSYQIIWISTKSISYRDRIKSSSVLMITTWANFQQMALSIKLLSIT